MSKSADTVRNGLVLRASLPSVGELRAIATELAVKVAEQLGIAASGDGGLTSVVEELARRVQPGGEDVVFEFFKQGSDLKIEARAAGRASEAHIPLPA
jgi:hypothetical protein